MHILCSSACVLKLLMVQTVFSYITVLFPMLHHTTVFLTEGKLRDFLSNGYHFKCLLRCRKIYMGGGGNIVFDSFVRCEYRVVQATLKISFLWIVCILRAAYS